MKYILAYDLGTGGTKSSVYNVEGQLIASEFYSVNTYYPQEKFHEQRPDDWWESVAQSIRKLISASGINPTDVLGIAGSGHSLGAVPVSKDGCLLMEQCPIWSDARADVQAACFFELVDEQAWYLRTGNGFPASQYAAFKIMWLMDHYPEIYAEADCFLGTKDYVNYRLTGVMGTDHSYASGSGLYDLQARRYDDMYIAASGVDPQKLPLIFESAHILGSLPCWFSRSGCPSQVPKPSMARARSLAWQPSTWTTPGTRTASRPSRTSWSPWDSPLITRMAAEIRPNRWLP